MHRKTSRLIWLLPLLLIASGCRQVAASSDATQLSRCETLEMPGVPWRTASPSTADQLALRRARFEVLPWGLAFAANRDNELLLLDSSFQQVRRVGRAGGGPGDLSGPVAVRASGPDLAVMEGGNGRISFWSREGEYLTSFPLASTSAEFGVDAARVVITPSGDGASYAARTDPTGSRTPLGNRTPPPSASGPSYLLDMAARLTDGSIFVFDNSTQEIARLSIDGDTVELFLLPESLERAITQARADAERSFRDIGISQSLAGALREFRGTDHGQLFIRPIGDRMMALLIDPRTMRCTELIAPRDSIARATMLGAYSMTVAQQRLYVVSAAGDIAAFALPAAADPVSATATR